MDGQDDTMRTMLDISDTSSTRLDAGTDGTVDDLSGRERADQMIRETERMIGTSDSEQDSVVGGTDDVEDRSLSLKMDSDLLL